MPDRSIIYPEGQNPAGPGPRSSWDQFMDALSSVGPAASIKDAARMSLRNLGTLRGDGGAQPLRDTSAADLAEERQGLLGRLIQDIPTEQERLQAARVGLADQAYQANQNLVANATRRGLLHSGILAAEKARLQRGLGQAALAAQGQARLGPLEDRARLLALIGQDQPLPFVSVRRQGSGESVIPFIGGLAGAGVGAFGGPSGAALGYQIGSGLGQAAGAGSSYDPLSRRR